MRKGVKGAQVTKGGAYAKYDKKSKAAGSFRAAYKKGCAGDSKGFSWDGRKYNCDRADQPKMTKAQGKKMSETNYKGKGGQLG